MKPTFAVIKVDQDYDYVQGCCCLGAFKTKKEAEAFIAGQQLEADTSWKVKEEYVDKFLLTLPPLVTDAEGPAAYLAWKPYIEKFYPFEPQFYSSIKGIREQLRKRLLESSKKDVAGLMDQTKSETNLHYGKSGDFMKAFDPPEAFYFSNAFIVEIPTPGE